MSNLETNLNVAATGSKLDLSDLMIALFQAVYQVIRDTGEDVTDVTEYLEHCAPDIDRLGRVLKFLGLAEDNPQSAFGWKATPDLMRLVAERATSRTPKASNKKMTKGERAILSSLLQLAGGWAEESIGDDFVFRVLNGLGLLRASFQDECKPTALLREILQNMLDS
jgi:hypothetical protein